MKATAITNVRLPPIRRMRGWRLYADDGSRWLDLRLLDNRGFLGAKGRFACTRAKNGVDLGILKEAPSRHEERLLKTLREAFPSLAAFRLFRNEERALAALGRVLGRSLSPEGPLDRGSLFDPLRRDTNAPGAAAPAAVERFFLTDNDMASTAAFAIRLIPLPCPEPFGPAVLAFADAKLAEALTGDGLAPILPFTALRAWADFQDPVIPLKGGRRARSGEGAPSYTETLWAKADKRLAPYFERRGPYLYAKCAEAEWPAFRAASLAGGCVLTPEWELPSIVPGDFDDGELKKMAEALGGI
jgi:hypothetical protein